MKIYVLVNQAPQASFTHSAPLQLLDANNFSMQVTFSGGTGNDAGTFFLEVSDTGNPDVAAEWAPLEDSPTAVTAATGVFYNISRAEYRYVRLAWTPTLGTGNITCVANVKEIVLLNG